MQKINWLGEREVALITAMAEFKDDPDFTDKEQEFYVAGCLAAKRSALASSAAPDHSDPIGDMQAEARQAKLDDFVQSVVPERSGKLADVTYKEVGSFMREGFVYVATSSDDPRGIKLYRPSTEADSSSAAPSEIEPFDDFPEFHQSAMGCGLEDRNITDRYDAMRYGWDEAIDRVGERIAQYCESLALAAPSPTGESLSAPVTMWQYRVADVRKQFPSMTHEEAAHNALLSEVVDLRAALATPRQTEDGSGLPSDDDVYQEMQARRDSRAVYISTGCVSDVMQVVRDLAASGSSAAAAPTSVQGGVPEWRKPTQEDADQWAYRNGIRNPHGSHLITAMEDAATFAAAPGAAK